MIDRLNCARYAPRPSERGQALILILLLLGLATGLVVYNAVSGVSLTAARDNATALALAQAKAALIGYAVARDFSSPSNRPGDLPCPDMNNDGTAGGSCSNGGGTTLGRLPWQTLGLPDLRDGSGERLWYAVSSNFKYNPRTSCTAPGQPGCLNSDMRGTITIRDKNGVVLNDATNIVDPSLSGVIAVVFAPGAPLTRQGAAAAQDRSAVGVNSAINYLDVGNGEDNAVFTDGTADGFINGDVVDATGTVIVNDRLLTITYQDLIPLIERRVAKEVLNCLTAYANASQNNGRYPWAAPVSNTSPPYGDQVNTRFGRLPDTLGATVFGAGGPVANAVCPFTPALCMQGNWPASCSTTGAWWTNWKELVFYGVAQAYQPADPVSTLLGVPAGGPCGSCLTVDPPSAVADKRVVVIVAGKQFSPAQNRIVPGNSSFTNYLEDLNLASAQSAAPDSFTKQPRSAIFDDNVLYQ